MPQWEYVVLLVESESLDYRCISPNISALVHGMSSQEMLDTLGHIGWELVTIIFDPQSFSMTYFLKRPG